MIKAKVKFKRPKLTVEQKALKKCVTQLARSTKAKIKSDAPKVTGALKRSVDYKVLSKGRKARSIIGVKSKFEAKGKIPNKYAGKAEDIHHFLKRHINSALVEELRQAVKRELEITAK